jgi:diadenylate cyclase
VTDLVQTITEVAILALIYYGFIRHLQATRGGGLLAGFIVLVMTAVVSFFIVLKQFDLPRLEWIANAALPVLGVALLVIFQPELRLAISRLGNIRIFRLVERLFGTAKPIHRQKLIKSIVRACGSMAKTRTGALMVVERREGIDGFGIGGVRVNADASTGLLENIFYKGAPLHDGAVLIIGGRVMYAACHLPAPSGINVGLSHNLGTRHRAAVGLSEQSDAMVIVVSEETGRISIAHRGKLRLGISEEELEAAISEGINVQFDTLDKTETLPLTAEAIGEDDLVRDDDPLGTDPISSSDVEEMSK